jgi:hypothetical protein
LVQCRQHLVKWRAPGLKLPDVIRCLSIIGKIDQLCQRITPQTIAITTMAEAITIHGMSFRSRGVISFQYGVDASVQKNAAQNNVSLCCHGQFLRGKARVNSMVVLPPITIRKIECSSAPALRSRVLACFNP